MLLLNETRSVCQDRLGTDATILLTLIDAAFLSSAGGAREWHGHRPPGDDDQLRPRVSAGAGCPLTVRKHTSSRHFILKMMILPRQARDKQRGNSKKRWAFFSHADSWPRSNWLICNPRLPSLKWLVQTTVRTNERTNERKNASFTVSFWLSQACLGK